MHYVPVNVMLVSNELDLGFWCISAIECISSECWITLYAGPYLFDCCDERLTNVIWTIDVGVDNV